VDDSQDKDEIETKANNKNKKGSRTNRRRDSTNATLSRKSQDPGAQQICKACGSGGHLLMGCLTQEGATFIQREPSNEKDGRPHASQRHIPQAGRGGSTPEQGESQRRARLNRERCWPVQRDVYVRHRQQDTRNIHHHPVPSRTSAFLDPGMTLHM
jgi:hypothetical protein